MPLPRSLVPVFGLMLVAGCTLPVPPSRKIDQNSALFKEAFAREKELQENKGLSSAAAEKVARQLALSKFVMAEKERRTKQIAPLVQALASFAQPRGCWAYTAVTTTKRENGKVTLAVEQFDPFQPDERRWTLISLNGQEPDGKDREDYRRRKLRAAKKTAERKKKKSLTESERVQRTAMSSKIEAVSSLDSTSTTFILTGDRIRVPSLISMPASRDAYVVENNLVQSRTTTYLGPASAFAGSAQIDHFNCVTEYGVIDPSLPPFVIKTAVQLRARFFGMDTGNVESETEYTDYRRVKCYDDRFETSAGEVDVMDFIPERN